MGRFGANKIESDMENKDDYSNEDKELLFKFMPFNTYSLQTIINNTLYFNKASLLNDPLDCQYEIEYKNLENFPRSEKELFGKILRRPYQNQKISFLIRNIFLYNSQKYQKEFLSEFINSEVNENFGICSFSFTPHENLLWSHYADKATGICVVFNKEKLLKSINENLKDSYYRIISDYIRYKGKKKLIIKLNKKGFSYTSRHFYSKTKHWRYEKEFRILLLKRYPTFLSVNYPYEFHRVISFSKESIHSIILGERIDAQNERLLLNILNNNNLQIPLAKISF